MSEFEIMEALTEFAKLDSYLSAALDEEAAGVADRWAANQEKVYQNFAETNPFEEGIESVVRNPEKGGFDIKIKVNGRDETFNTRDVNADFQGRLSIEEPREPNIMEGFKKFGLKEGDFKTENWKSASERQTNAFRNDPQTKEFDDVRESKKASKGRTDPKNSEEFQKQTEKQLDDLKKKLDKINKEKDSSAGRWVKSSLKWMALGFGAVELYNQIKAHQDAMNGCWLVAQDTTKAQPSQRCKVDILTCNSDCLTNTNNSDPPPYTVCSYCTDFQNANGTILQPSCMGGNLPKWNPAAPGCAVCPDDPPYYGCDKNQNCIVQTKDTSTIQYKNDPTCKDSCSPGSHCAPKSDLVGTHNLLPGKYQCGRSDCTKTTCASGCSCISTNDACPPKGATPGGPNCSLACNAINYQLPPNFVMQCVNADFWTAADDYFKGGIGELDNIFKKVIKIIIIIIIILLLLALVVGGVKLLFNKLSKK